ncbi:MAG: hypothetical protein LBJ41_03350 [Treponema sp.]|jgi:hypothetical protein|nr:hypothetical protein [Treponema sp.]
MIKRLGILFLSLAGIVLYACASYPVSTSSRPNEERLETHDSQRSVSAEQRLIRTEPEQKPAWIDTLPKTGEELFFVGVSRAFATAADARNDARENAFIQVMRFYGEFIQASAVEKTYVTGNSAETITALINREEEISNFAQAVVSQIGTGRYYTEVYLDGQNREAYVVYALCQIPRQKAEQDIEDFAKNTSERYGNLLARLPTLHSALLVYGDTLAALEQNPLHRAVAYYDSPSGRVNLYEYIGLQLNTLVGSVSFVSLPSAAVEKTSTLDTTITVSSPLAAVIGTVDCAVSIYGMNNHAPKVIYTVSADNSFSLKIFSSHLEPGRYTVQLELLLNEINHRVRKNPLGSFSFEVRPMTAAVHFVISGDSTSIGDTEKNALIQGIQQGIQTYGVPVSLKTDAAEPDGAVFTVSLNLRQQAPVPPSNRTLLICDATIAFSRDGATQESASKRITEIDATGMVGQVRKFIGENQSFFQNVINRLSQ